MLWKVLIGRRKPASSPERVKGRETPWLNNFNLNLSVLPITRLITRAVSHNILVAQLDSNLGSHIRQVRQIIHHEVAAASRLRKISEHFRTRKLFRGASAARAGLVNPYTIYLYVRLAHQITNLGRGVTAAVIASIGDDDQR